MSNPGTSEWSCVCKDCLAEFRYSNTNHEQNKLRGFSRPERCPDCRKQHSKEVNTVGQPYFKVKPLFPNVDHLKLESVLGRLDHPARPHRAEHVVPPGEPPDKFGIKDDKIVEMFRWFAQDPGLQVVVVVGPTGSGKSTYFPYRLVHPPRTYTTTEQDPTSPGTRRPVCGPDGKPLVFDASDVQPDLFHRYGQIVVTQPRIQATRNIPGYIARAMLGSSLGAGFDIGYQYAKNPASDWRSKLRFCTDGSLINWIATGQLDKINTVMIDEAHERSLNIDIIIGLLTQALPRYPRLKLVIASATISADLFIDHFNKHLPRRSPAKMLRLGDETAARRKLTLTTTERDAAGRDWLVKPADNCELMEFDGKSFRVDPHFHEGPPLDYAFLDPSPKDKAAAEAVEARIQKLAKVAHEKVAEKAIALLRDMYLTPDDLRAGKGLRVTKTVEPDGTIPKVAPVVDVTERRGDVLGFLHGEMPILECCKLVRAAAAEAGFPCKVESLPLYTQLPQSEQDKALLERTPGVHDKLVDRIVRQFEAGKTDVLAAHDNVGQFATIRRILEGRVKLPLTVQRWAGEDAVELKPGSVCERRTGAKLSSKPAGGVRVVVASSRALAVWGVPYESTPEGSDVGLADATFAFVPQEPEVRRVVVSTNVAETSLTIHGILHVVDSGLINQNKWMPDTQTTGVRPILQSRAGCKQRWGRAGRLQAGDAWPLYTREQFGLDAEVNEPLGSAGDDRCFPYYSQPEIRRSPLEQVLLTAKKAGLESLDVANFPWLEPPDAEELKRAESSLKGKGALDAEGRLTAHGLELSGFQSEARLANLMVVADRMACAVEMATVLAVLKIGYGKLFVKNKEWDEATAKRVQEVQASLTAPCADDLEAALKIVAGWEMARSSGQALADLWAWRSAWTNLIAGHGGAARKLADAMGTMSDEDGFAAVRPPNGDPLRPIFDGLRVEAARGVKRRVAWAEAEAQWNVVTRLPGFAAAWRAAATEATRIEGVADEVLRFALDHPAVPAFLGMLATIEGRVPAPTPDPASPAPDPATQETLRQEAAEKFLAVVADALTKFGRSLPPRGNPPPDGQSKADEESEATWRKLDSLARDFVRNLGPRFRVPATGTEGLTLIEAAESARSLADLENLQGEAPWLERVRSALPTVAAEAWCAANYVDSRTIADKDKIESARSELIDTLSGHKKEEERRPLNFALLDRLRLIFAHALPDHCYELAVEGYQPVLPGPTAMPAVIEKDSICAARAPRLMVCANRRALPADAKGQRKLGAGFVVVLDGEGCNLSAALVRGEGGRKPLGEWSTLSLATHLPEQSPAQAVAETASARARLLLDQSIPLGSEWTFVPTEPDGEGWLATGSLLSLRGEVRKRYRNEQAAETADDTDPGGDFTSSTFAVETPDPVLDPESPDSEGKSGGRRPIMITEGVSPDTSLGGRVRDEDLEREAQTLFDADAAELHRPRAAVPSPKPTLFRIRFVTPAKVGAEKAGTPVRGWVIGFEHTDGKSPLILLGRRSPRDAIAELLDKQEQITVEVVGRATGAASGVRVRVQGGETETTMTPRDFGFRDDYAVTEAVLAEWEKSKKLAFAATVWEAIPDDGILRLTTFHLIEAWFKANSVPLESGTLVRSNPANPDRVSVIVRHDPVNGLVIAADAGGTQFKGVPSGTVVPIRIDRPRDGRRSPDVKRSCPLPAGAEALGLVALPNAGRTRYVRDNGEAMSVADRFALIGLAPADEAYRSIVDELYEQSNGLFAESPTAAAAADDLVRDLGQELIGRVVEVNPAGARLEASDAIHPAATLKMWLSNKECGGDAASRFAVGDEIVVRSLGDLPAAGQLNVTLRPPPRRLAVGTPTEIVTRDDGSPSSLRVSMMSGVDVFCPLGELFPNVENPTNLIDMVDPRPMPFLVRGPRGDRTDVSLSHKRAGLMALRCRYPKLVGQAVRGTVHRLITRPARDDRPSTTWAEIEFGTRLRAQCPVSQLGIGQPENLEAAARGMLASAPFQAMFQITGWHDADEFLQLSARPVWETVVQSTLVNQTVVGTVVGARHPFLTVQLAPFVFAGCHVSQLGTERIDDVTAVAGVGDSLVVRVTGFDEKGWLQVSPREAVLGELERRCGEKYSGTVARVVGGGSLIIRLAPGLTGFCPGREMPDRVFEGEVVEVCVVAVDRVAKGTPIQLSGNVPPGPSNPLPNPRPTAAASADPAALAELADLFESATAELLTALRTFEEAISHLDLDSADKAVRALRASFPNREDEPCPFSRRVELYRGLYKRLADVDPQAARRYWPTSTHLPPAPPRAVRIAARSGEIALTWKAAAAPESGVTYRVRRGADVLADQLTGCEFTDTRAPTGIKLEYIVVAVANGKETAATPVSLFVPGEVSNLTVTPGDRRVVLAWAKPLAADKVEVWRKPAGQADSQTDWRLIARVSDSKHIDEGLPNEQAFLYRVTAVYGGESSPGVSREVIPFRPPSPVVWDSLMVNEGSISLTWRVPPKGYVALVFSPRPVQTGVSRLTDFPHELTRLPGDGKFKGRLPASGVYYLVPVVEDRGVVVVGSLGRGEWVEPIRGFTTTEYMAGRLRLSWNWPAGVTVAKLVVRTDRPPSNATDGKVVSVARVESQSTAKLELPMSEGQAFVQIFAGVTDAANTSAEGRESLTQVAGQFAGHLREPRTVRYQVRPVKKWLGLASSGQFDLTVTSASPVILAVSVCSITFLTLTAFGLWPIGWLEAWGFITGGISVWLTVRENVWIWPIGIANNIVFLALFWQDRLFPHASLQIVCIALSIYGWLNWRRGTSGGRLEIRYASRAERLICIVFVVMATWILSDILVAANGDAPFWDAFTTALCFAAQALMCRKRIDHWIIWIVADLVYVPLYFQRGLPLTSAFHLVFLMLCIAGLKRWSSGMSQMGNGSK